MNSKIYFGYVEHERYLPVSHKFKYPIYFYGLDLDELQKLDQKLFFFGYNRMRPAAIHDMDYLDERPGSMKDKLLRILKEQKPSLSVSSIRIITSARYLNYIFNPVSFFYCFDNNNHIVAMVVEVNNTFGERHVYIPEKISGTADSDGNEKYHTRKAFHVSPFNNMEGEYDFYFPVPDNDINIRIDLNRENGKVFSARLFGTALELTSANLFKMIIRHPIIPYMTKSRIFIEAARLYFARHLKYHDKPEPISPMTIKK